MPMEYFLNIYVVSALLQKFFSKIYQNFIPRPNHSLVKNQKHREPLSVNPYNGLCEGEKWGA